MLGGDQETYRPKGEGHETSEKGKVKRAGNECSGGKPQKKQQSKNHVTKRGQGVGGGREAGVGQRQNHNTK